jgi:hypothetical protein
MSKLLVAPKHDPRPMPNGHDGCHARLDGTHGDFGIGGGCPGVRTAEWLNGLGEDEAPYRSSTRYKNIDVRLNWLRDSNHIVALDTEVARLREIERRAQKELANARERLVALGETIAPVSL